MLIRFQSNDGGGYPSSVEVTGRMTLQEFLTNQLGETVSHNDYQIRVNREIQPASYFLQEGDRVTATPQKIANA